MVDDEHERIESFVLSLIMIALISITAFGYILLEILR